MARVTVEDCIEVVGNRYELVLLAAQRARDISAGAPLTISRDNDKNTVVALREIAGQTINLDELRKHIARGVNRTMDLTAEDDELLALAGATTIDDSENMEGVEFTEIGGGEEEGEEVEAASETEDGEEMPDFSQLPDLDELAAEVEDELKS